jgi:uncharacterized SAM-binding protein YcdF (DUF218 family)
MFFVASKLLGFLVQPSNLLITLVVVGWLLLLTRRARAGQRLVISSCTLLAVGAILPIGNWMLFPLEQRFPPWKERLSDVDGIIVLGGVLNPEISATRPYPGIGEAAERIFVTTSLAYRYPNSRIIYAGGAESRAALGLFEELGVPRSRIESEERSRNTIENVLFAKEIANPKLGEHWLVVTSAFHTPRAIGVFRQNAFPVEAYPTDWRVRASMDLFLPASSLSDGLRRLDLAVHEWAGLLAYRLARKSSAFFPAPVE